MTRTSLDPSAGVMNPKPLLSLNHLTWPLILDITETAREMLSCVYTVGGYKRKNGAARNKELRSGCSLYEKLTVVAIGKDCQYLEPVSISTAMT